MSGPATLFAELAETIYAAESVDSVYQAVVESAVKLVDGCDRACLTLVRHRRFTTVAFTDEVARATDVLERELGEGPCLDAVLDEVYQHDPNIEQHSQWPKLAERIVATTPIRGMLAYRLLIDGEKAGALDLFSDTPDALTMTSADQGAVLASFASVAVMTATARGEASQLRAGLESNREIGKAIGLLMAAHRVPQERALEILKATSQQLNIKASAVAAEIVEGQERQYRG
jgi:transcriptional regulator with GAF, ATPase, and Fis domain